MNHDIKDLGTTSAGGIGAAGMLATVRWEAVPYGEVVKIALAVLFLLLGYKGYRKGPEAQ